MKIRIRYKNGNYWAVEYTAEHEAKGIAFVEISNADWREYQEHLEAERGWHDWFRGLANEQYEKDEPLITD